MLSEGNPASRSAVFDDPEVIEKFPMADLIRDSIDEAVPRPQSPYYTDISAATVREFHPPASVEPRLDACGRRRPDRRTCCRTASSCEVTEA